MNVLSSPPSPVIVVRVLNEDPAGTPAASLVDGAGAPKLQLAAEAAPVNDARWIVSWSVRFASGTVNSSRTSSATDPPLKLPTLAETASGASAPALWQMLNSEMPPGE